MNLKLRINLVLCLSVLSFIRIWYGCCNLNCSAGTSSHSIIFMNALFLFSVATSWWKGHVCGTLAVIVHGWDDAGLCRPGSNVRHVRQETNFDHLGNSLTPDERSIRICSKYLCLHGTENHDRIYLSSKFFQVSLVWRKKGIEKMRKYKNNT